MLAVLTALALIFFGFILPSHLSVSRVAQLRAMSDRNARLARRVEAREALRTWGTSRSEDSFERLLPLDVEIVEELLPQLQKAAGGTTDEVKSKAFEELDANKLDQLRSGCTAQQDAPPAARSALAKACTLQEQLEKLQRQADETRIKGMEILYRDAASTLQKASAEKSADGSSLERKVEEAAKELPSICEEVQRIQASAVRVDRVATMRETCRKYSLVRYKATQEQIHQELTEITKSQLSLKFLGLFGVEADDLEDLKIPLLYLPVAWSLLLFILLLYVGSNRGVMLNLYARAARSQLEGSNKKPEEIAEELGGIPYAPWWWLAPLPPQRGEFLDGKGFRDALGWKSFHSAACLGILLSLSALVALQWVVADIGSQLAFAFTDGVDAEGQAWKLVSYYQWELWLIVPLLLATAIANTVLVVRWVSPYAIVPDSKPTDEEASDFRRLAAGVFAISLVGVLIPFLRSPRRLPTAATLKPQKRFRKKAPPEVKASALAQGFYRNPLSGGLHYVLPAVRAGSWVPARHTRSKRRRKPLIRLERRYRHALVAEWYASGAGLKSYPRQERSKERSPSRPIRPAMARPARFWRMLEMPRTSLMHVPLMDVFKPFEVPAHPPSRPKSITRRLEPSDMVFALEQESLRLVREGRVDEACQFLFRVLEQRDRWSRSLLRLFDLFAIITVTRQRPQLLDALIHLVELELSPKQTDETSKEPVPRMTAARFPELAQRVQSWKNPNSNWRRRWSKKSNWTGLPM